ncbi:HPF/RaiA family ribosome-associated protein [Lysobacter sp. A03]|uniref:HPF/RaiA family ribosome-associated protein n=1 Tax=Lysobacter sp. A03 TaxID=1199154 RepID=UPI0005B6BBB0|nr:HPF/RaiA family ribosome-associated protein [Lysobacter sp. A03]KIQ96452.1 putative ribosomal subunit interface protein [Lysobacter sp. A03]
MKIQLNTDRNIQGDESVAAHVDKVVNNVLSRFASQITRIEVHLSDLNADKSGQHDKRCLMEARLASRDPVAVTAEAATVQESINGAAQKLKSKLDSSLGKLAADERKPHNVAPGADAPVLDQAIKDIADAS